MDLIYRLKDTLIRTEPNEETVSGKLFGVYISLVIWAAIYHIQLWIWPGKSAEWRCRVVSLVHGVVVTLLSYYSQFVEGPAVFGIEPGLGNNSTQVFIVKVCLGYFVFDLVWCLYYQTERPIMIVHHCLSVFGMVNMLFQGKWGTELIAVIGSTEISNPLLQLRWFLRNLGYSKTIIGEIVDFSFIAVFSIFRLAMGGYVMVSYVSYPNDDILGKVGAVTMFSLSVVFYYYIIGYAKKKYGKMFSVTPTLTHSKSHSNGSAAGTAGTTNSGPPHHSRSSAQVQYVHTYLSNGSSHTKSK